MTDWLILCCHIYQIQLNTVLKLPISFVIVNDLGQLVNIFIKRYKTAEIMQRLKEAN